jgi:UPF0716 protein FxsA
MVKRTFLTYVVLELAVLALLTWTIGLGWTLLVLLATSATGVALAGSQARRQITRLQELSSRPRGSVADGLLVALGTVFVFVPGLVTTLMGALMLLPPTRTLMRPVAGAVINRAVPKMVPAVTLTPGGYGDYIDAEVLDEQVLDDQVMARVHEVSVLRRV